METVVTAKRDKAAALRFLKRIMKKYGPTAERRHRRALLLSRGNEGDRQCRSPRGWSSPQQSGGKLASAFSTTRASHAAVPKCQDATEIQLSSCSGPQPFQPGTSSRRPRNLQTETLGRGRRVARAHGLMAARVWGSYVTDRRPAVALTTPRQHPNDLLFREPRSLHLSVLFQGQTLNPREGKSEWQVTGERSQRR